MSTCTSASRHLGEPLAGTAATARTWLLLEQPGPWGVKALTSSHLDPAIGRALETAAEGTGVRVALIRRPGRHADCREVRERRVYVAHTVPGNVWLHSATTTDPEQLLDLDLTALGRGDHRTFGTALRGRPHTGAPSRSSAPTASATAAARSSAKPLAAELAASGVEGTWEVTHLGGHRFSPTVLVLPFGYIYGRAEAHHVKEVLQGVREGRVVTEGCRGSSAWERPGQAAELAVRTETGEDAADSLTVLRSAGSAPHWDVTVAHTDGRRWTVAVSQGAAQPPRPESCGSALGSPARMDVLTVRELSPAAVTR